MACLLLQILYLKSKLTICRCRNSSPGLCPRPQPRSRCFESRRPHCLRHHSSYECFPLSRPPTRFSALKCRRMCNLPLLLPDRRNRRPRRRPNELLYETSTLRSVFALPVGQIREERRNLGWTVRRFWTENRG